MLEQDKVEAIPAGGEPQEPSPEQPLSVREILEQMKIIQNQTDHIRSALTQLALAEEGSGSDARFYGIQGIVSSREETNRKLLSIYEKMYDDLMGRKAPAERAKGFVFNFGQKRPGSTQGGGHGRRSRVMEFLGNKDLSSEARELLLNDLDELNDLSDEMQEHVLQVLADPSLAYDEKELLMNNLDELGDTDEELFAQVVGVLRNQELDWEAKEQIFDNLSDLSILDD